MDLALNNLQKLICHKTQTINQPNQTCNLQFMISVPIKPTLLIRNNSRIKYASVFIIY